MTKKEISALTAVAERISELASLENCGLDEGVKKEMKPYMVWFDCCSQFLKEIVELQNEKDRWLKSEKLSEIIRRC